MSTASSSLSAWLDTVGPRWLLALDDAQSRFAAPDAALPISHLARAFALDEPVIALVELLAAVELHRPLARRVAENGGMTVAMARELIPMLGPPMLAVATAVRRFEIVFVEPGPRATARLWLGEPVFDRLCGQAAFDPALDAAARELTVAAEPLPGLAEALAMRGRDGLSPIVVLPQRGADEAGAGLTALGLRPFRLRSSALPETAEARSRWVRLWARDAALDSACLVAEAPTDPAASALLAEMLDPLMGHVVVAGALPSGQFSRPVHTLNDPVSGGDPASRWRRAFGRDVSARLEQPIAAMSRRFHLDGATLDALAADIGPRLLPLPDHEATRLLWRAAARAVSPAQVPGVRMVEPTVGWDDIVLPAQLTATLRRIEAHVRHTHRVMIDWGFSRASGERGTGVAALFAGPSGTGKTMAAEMLAAALDLRMMLIDISQITSKYIGETAKNVAAAFAEAERTGAAMVWNEGDAIWGARGAVGNATDRHVNAEVGDLLQRIEAFTGFTIVTTNMKGAIDPAFLRRFRFVAEFALPGPAEREAIWRRVFPPRAPLVLAEEDWARLASVGLSGGAIRNAALSAAFAAADTRVPITLPLIAEEIAAELRKVGQPMPVLMPSEVAA